MSPNILIDHQKFIIMYSRLVQSNPNRALSLSNHESKIVPSS